MLVGFRIIVDMSAPSGKQAMLILVMSTMASVIVHQKPPMKVSTSYASTPHFEHETLHMLPRHTGGPSHTCSPSVHSGLLHTKAVIGRGFSSAIQSHHPGLQSFASSAGLHFAHARLAKATQKVSTSCAPHSGHLRRPLRIASQS